MIHRLREHGHLLVPGEGRGLVADVVDGTADDEADGVEPGFLDEQELAGGEVRREQAPLLAAAAHLD